MVRFDLTDFKRSVIHPLASTKLRGKHRVDNRRVLSAFLAVRKRSALDGQSGAGGPDMPLENILNFGWIFRNKSLSGWGEERYDSIDVHGRAQGFHQTGGRGTPVAKLCRKAGSSSATYFNEKKQYAGTLPTDMTRLRELEDENSRLH